MLPHARQPYSDRYIDTARMYGNEAQVGEALRESGIARDQVFISE